MNKYVKEFLHRGLMFSGFGPIIVGIVYICISNSVDNFTLTASEVCMAIVSMYIVAFLQAGASVFNQIDNWSVPKSTLFHFLTIYVAYVGTYLLNRWIPFNINYIIIFTSILVVIYLVIWISVAITIRATSKRLNSKLK